MARATATSARRLKESDNLGLGSGYVAPDASQFVAPSGMTDKLYSNTSWQGVLKAKIDENNTVTMCQQSVCVPPHSHLATDP